MMSTEIIINATALGSQLSGIGVYLLALLTELAAMKSDLHFVVYVNKGAKTHVDGIQFPPHIEVKWTSRFISPDYNFTGHLLRLLYANFLSLRHWNSLCFNGSQLEAMLFRSRQVIMIHDIIPLLARGDHGKQFYYYRYLLPHALRSAAAIVVPSLVVKEQLRQVYGLPDEKIHVIYHGVEHAICNAGQKNAPDNDRYILYIGRERSHKNMEMLLRGFNRVQKELAHKLVIVGVDDNRKSKRRLTESDRIIFKGYVSVRERAALYRNASLLIFPSFHEGFGFPPLEAMLNACPVVASHTSCIPEICGDAAYYVEPADEESIAEGIRQVVTNDSMRKHLIERGLQRVQMFSWRTSAESHMRLIRSLLSA